jgi:hypothetical protein
MNINYPLNLWIPGTNIVHNVVFIFYFCFIAVDILRRFIWNILLAYLSRFKENLSYSFSYFFCRGWF